VGRLGVPPRTGNARAAWLVLACAVPIALFYPLVGATLVLALACAALLNWPRRRVT
jgi:uncharacterized iron-regulated membrane protein